MNLGLQNKIAVVTGGSRGIGREVVRQLAAEQAVVHFFYHQNKELADTLLAEATVMGWQVYAHLVDIRNKTQCHETIQNIFEKEQHLDILINNSGVVRDNLLIAFEDGDIETVLNTNVIGTMQMTQAVTPFMMSQRKGVIINISSVAGEKAGRGQSNYAASKGAINAFTRAMAVELAPRKIRVNAIAPGVIETDISKEVRESGGEEALSKILLKRYGKPEEVAHLATFLVSDLAEYITGQIFHIDGGFKMA